MDGAVQRVFTTKDESRRFYNKIAKIYDVMAESSEGPMRRKGLALMEIQPGQTVLELGYGTGHCLVELAQAVGPTGKVLGIDISDGMQAIAKETVTKAGLEGRVELLLGDAESLPFDDHSLDGVFTSFTLELFDTPDIPKVLAECRRVLKPGGKLGVVAVSKETKHGAIIEIYEWTHQHFPNFVDCRPIFVQKSMEEAGFTIAAAERETMWVPVELVVGINP